MELLTQTLGANETRVFAKAGRYFEIIDSIAPINIDFTGSGGGLSDSMRNALSGLYIEDPFSAFSVTNGNNPQTVTFLIMETGRGGSRRQPGLVSIVDTSRQLVQANVKALNSVAVGAGGAGNYSQGQVWNGSSAFGIAIRSLVFTTSDVATVMDIGFNLAVLPAVVTTLPMVSKKMTSAGQVALPAGLQTSRKADSIVAGYPGIPSFYSLALTLPLPAGNALTSLPIMDGPIVLGPGSGLFVANNTANSAFRFMFEAEVFPWVG